MSAGDPFDPNQWNGSDGVAAEQNRGETLASIALGLRGIRYRYGGATRDGFDCSGLVFYAHRQIGLTVPRTSRDQAEKAEEVKSRKLQPGDLVFFRIDSRRGRLMGAALAIGGREHHRALQAFEAAVLSHQLVS